MSLLTIFIKGFSGLGVASTIPLSFAFHNETFSFSSRGRIVPPPAPNKNAHQSTNRMDEMAKIVQKEIGNTTEKVEIGCFATSAQYTPLLRETLYVCTNLGADSPEAFWFYYSWGRRSSTIPRGAYQITKITYKNSWQVTMHLKNEEGEQTVDIAEKLKWAGREFDPKSNCSVTKSQDKYSFTCGSGDKSYKQEVLKNHFYTSQTPSLSQ